MTGAALVVVGLSMMTAKPALKFIYYRRWMRETAAETVRELIARDRAAAPPKRTEL
jgi:hypothetical protein